MNRRASLPGADELFRSTGRGGHRDATNGEDAAPVAGGRGAPVRGPARHDERHADTSAEASGRVKHDQKITVYLTEQELLDLEQARLRLRAEFDIAVDRGRIVREAVTELLGELHDRGPDAAIVRRLT